MTLVIVAFIAGLSPMIVAYLTHRWHLQDAAVLAKVKTLVDGTLTAVMQAERDAVTRELSLLHQITAIKGPSLQTEAAIEASETKIADIQEHIETRKAVE